MSIPLVIPLLGSLALMGGAAILAIPKEKLEETTKILVTGGVIAGSAVAISSLISLPIPRTAKALGSLGIVGAGGYIVFKVLTKEAPPPPPEFKLSGEVAYNGAKIRPLSVYPGGHIMAEFSVFHKGDKIRAYVGFALAKSRLIGHPDPDDIPQVGFFVKEHFFPVDRDWTRYDFVIEGYIPVHPYYTEGVYDVLRFVSPTRPKPYLIPENYDDDWDEDVYRIVPVRVRTVLAYEL